MRGRFEVAMEATRRILVPLVVEETFSFSEEDDAGSTPRRRDDMCAGNILIETPVAVTSRWNAEVSTKLVKLPDNMCGVRLDRSTSSATEDTDFRACVLDKAGLLGTKTTNPFGTCSKTIHVDGARVKKIRLVHTDPLGTYAILCLASPGAAQRSVFSRPVLKGSLLPQALIDCAIHLQLLKIEAKPRVLKFLLEGYPGKELMLAAGAMSIPTPP